ncbi:MAG: four helix bundle protein [bacterium]|nr:four helix bundle protein [bacterium]MDE0353024.1 four helix bundle protein [bacterium]
MAIVTITGGYQDLEVWQKSLELAEMVYRLSAREFLQFLGIASGSLAETETFLILASRLGMADNEHVQDVLVCADEVGRMLSGLKRALRLTPTTNSKLETNN